MIDNNNNEELDVVGGPNQLTPNEQDIVPAETDQPTAHPPSEDSLMSLFPRSLRLVIYGYDQVEDYLTEALSERQKHIPEERLISPSPVVAGPALDALRFVIDEPPLRELYANLLATSMDSATTRQAHPAFVEMLRQMTPDEARIVGLFKSATRFPIVTLSVTDADGKGIVQVLLRNFCLLVYEAHCEHPEMAANYLDNLRRLGLVEVIQSSLFDKRQYTPLLEHPDFLKWVKRIETETDAGEVIDKEILEVTVLGRQFRDACIISKAEANNVDSDEHVRILSFIDY